MTESYKDERGPVRLVQITTEYADVLAKRGESARTYDLLKKTLVERVRTPAAPPKRRAPVRDR